MCLHICITNLALERSDLQCKPVQLCTRALTGAVAWRAEQLLSPHAGLLDLTPGAAAAGALGGAAQYGQALPAAGAWRFPSCRLCCVGTQAWPANNVLPEKDCSARQVQQSPKL